MLMTVLKTDTYFLSLLLLDVARTSLCLEARILAIKIP